MVLLRFSCLVFFFCLCGIVLSVSSKSAKSSKRRKDKAFPIFSVVQISQTRCTVQSDTTMSGICMSENDCSNDGGIADGNCAAGFGVCCMFILNSCGGMVSQNCTYIQNEGFPATTTTLQTCGFTFNRICDDLCQVRLDFDNLVLTQPDATTGLCATTGDSAVAMSPTGASPPANICGTLTGQHMYLETGGMGIAGTFTITTSISTLPRSWKVKVSYIECDNPNRPRADCVQWFTGTAGTIQTYNFQGGTQLADQDYSFCLRQEEGFCSYQVQESAITMPDPFNLLAEDAAGNLIEDQTVTDCTTTKVGVVPTANKNFVTIPNSNNPGSLRCGEVFGNAAGDIVPGSVIGNTGDFNIGYFSDAVINNLGDSTGFSLDYAQLPCTT